jgi:hypothetical protein
MSVFALAPYSIRIKERSSRHYVDLDNIPLDTGKNTNILDIFENFLADLKGKPSDPDSREYFQVSQFKRSNDSIHGIFKSGEAGYGSQVIDTATGQTAYHKKRVDADTTPYYFLLALHPNADKGILILQKFKNAGIKGQFQQKFSDYLRSTEVGDNHSFEISPLVPKDLFRHYLESRIVKIRLIKQGFPGDLYNIDSSLALPEDKEFAGDVELVIKAERKGSLPFPFLEKFSSGVKRYLDSDSDDVGSIIEVKNFDFQTVKVEVNVGGSYRTIDLGKQDKIKYHEDISEIEVGSDGHPEFSGIDQKAKRFLQDLARSVFGGEVHV